MNINSSLNRGPPGPKELQAQRQILFPDQMTDVATLKTIIEEQKKQIDFLKSLATKTSEELARYQVKYPPLFPQTTPNDGTQSGSVVIPPWVLNSEYMSPLLLAYEQRIQSLEQENKNAKEKEQLLVTEVQNVVKENDTLHNKLRQTLESQLEKAENGTSTMQNFDVAVLELKEQNDLLEQENSSLKEQNSLLIEQVKEIQKEMTNMNSNYQFINQNSSKIKKLFQVVTAYEEKNLSLSTRVGEQHKRIQQVSQEKEATMQENADLMKRKEEYEQEIKLLRKSEQNILSQVGELERRVSHHQQCEFDALNKAKELVEVLEATKIERDRLKKQLSSKEEELDRTEKKIIDIKNETELRIKKIMDQAEEDTESSVKKLKSEIEELHLEKAELESQIEKQEREFKVMRQEMKRMSEVNDTEQVKNTVKMIESLSKERNLAIMEKDETEQRYQREVSRFKKLQAKFEEQQEMSHQETNEILRKSNRLQQEISEKTQQLVRITAELEKWRNVADEKTREFSRVQDNGKKKIEAIIDSHKLHIQELNSKIEELSERLQVEENKYSSQAQQTQRLLTKHQVYLKERKELLLQIDKLRMEVERLKNNNN